MDSDTESAVPVERRDLPNAFYDPITGHIMVDPVVNPAGDSYDKSSITDTTSVAYYPNRALQSVIQRETELASSSIRGSLRRFDEALQSGWGRLMEKSAFGASSRYNPLPESFYCSITCDVMVDPTIAPDGNSYEREAIKNWIRVNNMSPITRIPLTFDELRPNNALYELIQTEKRRTSETIHPAIQQWKESTAVTSRLQLNDPTKNDDEAAQPSAPPALQDQPPPASATNYPTTEAELHQQMQQRRQLHVACFIVFFFHRCCHRVVWPVRCNLACVFNFMVLLVVWSPEPNNVTTIGTVESWFLVDKAPPL
jgi:hypothetical protein